MLSVHTPGLTLLVLQILQLLCGVSGILTYFGMMALIIRFFPIRVCDRVSLDPKFCLSAAPSLTIWTCRS